MSCLPANLLLVNLQRIAISHFELWIPNALAMDSVMDRQANNPIQPECQSHTVSGVSSGRTRVPSNKKRTVDTCFP